MYLIDDFFQWYQSRFLWRHCHLIAWIKHTIWPRYWCKMSHICAQAWIVDTQTHPKSSAHACACHRHPRITWPFHERIGEDIATDLEQLLKIDEFSYTNTPASIPTAPLPHSPGIRRLLVRSTIAHSHFLQCDVIWQDIAFPVVEIVVGCVAL